MNLSDIRRIFLWSFIGFLSLTALIAIFSVLSHEFGETQIKVLATTFTVSAASICAMSCAAFIEKKETNRFGIIGMLFAGIAAAMTIIGIWGEISTEGYWKTSRYRNTN
jgi:FtsH-binding integral membrane protein